MQALVSDSIFSCFLRWILHTRSHGWHGPSAGGKSRLSSGRVGGFFEPHIREGSSFVTIVSDSILNSAVFSDGFCTREVTAGMVHQKIKTKSRVYPNYLSRADKSPGQSRNHTLLGIPKELQTSACWSTASNPAATPKILSFCQDGREGRNVDAAISCRYTSMTLAEAHRPLRL